MLVFKRPSVESEDSGKRRIPGTNVTSRPPEKSGSHAPTGLTALAVADADVKAGSLSVMLRTNCDHNPACVVPRVGDPAPVIKRAPLKCSASLCGWWP